MLETSDHNVITETFKTGKTISRTPEKNNKKMIGKEKSAKFQQRPGPFRLNRDTGWVCHINNEQPLLLLLVC